MTPRSRARWIARRPTYCMIFGSPDRAVLHNENLVAVALMYGHIRCSDPHSSRLRSQSPHQHPSQPARSVFWPIASPALGVGCQQSGQRERLVLRESTTRSWSGFELSGSKLNPLSGRTINPIDDVRNRRALDAVDISSKSRPSNCRRRNRLRLLQQRLLWLFFHPSSRSAESGRRSRSSICTGPRPGLPRGHVIQVRRR